MAAAGSARASKDGDDHEFAMSDADFRKIQKLIYQRAGISLTEQKRGLVYARLSRRLRTLGLKDFKSYLDLFDSPSAEAEFSHLINALTTNHTKFFRESHHFDFLRGTAAAQWKQRVTRGEPMKVRIWSAGCSTGEEPYTLAMTLANAFGMSWDWKILATDIDTKVLSHAKRGIYDHTSVASVPTALKNEYLCDVPGNGGVEVDDALKRRIRFNRLNLHEKWPMKGPFDAVFCRNVTIYFDPPTKKRLIQRFISMLRPNGYLFLGHSETLIGKDYDLKPLGKTVYQKVEGVGAG